MPTIPLVLLLCLCAAVPAGAADLLRFDALEAPLRAPAGSTVPVTARFTVMEPVRDGWRVSAELSPVAGGRRFVVGPEYSPFNSTTPVDTARGVSFSIPVPADAAPGRYRLIIDHYSQVNGEWVYLRYVHPDGRPAGLAVGEMGITPPLPPLSPPAPQRKLRAGEIHRVLECEDFQGMDGSGEDLGVAQGWTWYSHAGYSRQRAAVNTTGTGTLTARLDPPLPPGSYKVLARGGSPFCAVRVLLGAAPVEQTLDRVGWNDLGVVKLEQPADRLALEPVRKVGSYVIVDSLYVTNDLAVGPTTGRDPSRQLLLADARPVKARRTIYTEEYLRGVRRRMGESKALREAAEKAIAEARKVAGYSDTQLWNLLVDTRVQRAYYVNQLKGCPVCGLKIKEVDAFHPWILDPISRPCKMQCPSCKGIFPTNDYAAGEKVGGAYPDDGTGCRIGDDVYRFIGEYAHFTYRNYFQAHLRALTEGLVLTGDPALAHKLGVMLLRAAQQYPNSEDGSGRTYRGAWGLESGCITDTVWSSYEGRDYGQAYDAVWPFLDRDAELLALARREIPGIATPEDLRLTLEEGLLRRVGQAYCDAAIQGNPGFHHKGMACLLLALDDMGSTRFPNSRDLLEFLYYRIYGAMRTFPNLAGRDGSSFESPGYNGARLSIVATLDYLDRFFALHGREVPRARYPDLWDDPRFAAQFDYFTDVVLLDRFLPVIGDTGGTVIPKRAPASRLSEVAPDVALAAWRKYRSPRLALLAYGLKDEPPSPSLWEDRPLKALAKARAAAPARMERATSLLDDYGLAILRSGKGEDARALWLWYGSLLDHGHDDMLSFGLAGKGLDLLPELGYPKSWDHAGRWEANSLTHNTVAVDGSAFRSGGERERGSLGLLGTLPGFQVVEAVLGKPSANGPVARRLLGLVDLGGRDFYAIDLFDVRGGSSHTLSTHGPQAEVTLEGIAPTEQAGGTVAGPGVAYGQPYRDTDGREVQSPLGHMTEVQRAKPTAPFAVDYAVDDETDVHVRLRHFPGPGTDLALGTGRPPSQPDAYRVRFALQTRSGAAPLASRFLTVVEPYGRVGALRAVERLTQGAFGTGEALRVEGSGATDLLLFGPEADTRTAAGGVELVGRAGLVRSAGGSPALLCAHAFRSLRAEGISLQADAPFLTGRILSCDYPGRRIVVAGVPDARALVGMPVRIHNALHSSMYTIASVRRRGRNAELTLSTTALRHEGWASGISDGAIRDGAPSPWAFTTYLAGTRLVSESGSAEWRVSSAAGGWWSAPTGTHLALVGADGRPAPADALRSTLIDNDRDGTLGFRLYDYGVGDNVEIASFARVQRDKHGRWAGTLSPGVRLVVGTAGR